MKKMFMTILLLLLASLLMAGGNQRYAMPNSRHKSNISLNSRNHLFIGYTSNIPNQFLGFNLFTTFPKKIGIYLDMKGPFSLRSESDDFYDNISVNKAENIFGDNKTSTDEDWLTINLGFTKTVLDNALIFVGTGYSDHTLYNQYYDEFEILGSHGKYWIERKSNSGINFFGGGMIILSSKVILQIGVSSYPGSLILGFGYLII